VSFLNESVLEPARSLTSRTSHAPAHQARKIIQATPTLPKGATTANALAANPTLAGIILEIYQQTVKRRPRFPGPLAQYLRRGFKAPGLTLE
jgi:hypothetical protein